MKEIYDFSLQPVKQNNTSDGSRLFSLIANLKSTYFTDFLWTRYYTIPSYVYS